jgi:Zn-dependent protease
LTLNPLRHLDPFGSILLLIAGFGWGKPVPVDPRNLRYGRLGMAMVSAAGPLSNLAVAFLTVVGMIAAFPSRAATSSHPVVFSFLISLALLNVALCLFNLLPIAPLDGFGVVVGVLPWSIASPIARLGHYGPGILLLLVFLPRIAPIDPLGALLGPVRSFVFNAIIGAASFLVHAAGTR